MGGAGDVEGLLTAAVRAGRAYSFVGLAQCRGRGRLWSAGQVRRGGEAAGPDVLYDLASLTKPLATATLLLLARRDGIELDTPLQELLPELEGSPFGGVTCSQAAAHQGGFPAWAPLYARGTGRQRVLEALTNLAPVSGPGERVEYSCPGFIALGLALEHSAGASLGELFDSLVAEPLGLLGEIGFLPPDAGLVAGGAPVLRDEEELGRRAGWGCAPPVGTAIEPADGNARALGSVAGNAGLFGTAAAVAALAAEYLPGGGDLLTAEEASLATRAWAHGNGQVRGLGWQLAASEGCSAGPALPPDAFGHSGYTGTSVWASPDTGTITVLLANRLHPGGRGPDLHPLRRRFNTLAAAALPAGTATARMAVR